MKIHDRLWYKLTGGSHVFSSWENKSCTWSICADVCTEVSGYFHPNFQDIFITFSTTILQTMCVKLKINIPQILNSIAENQVFITAMSEEQDEDKAQIFKKESLMQLSFGD